MAAKSASDLIASKVVAGSPWFVGRLGTPESNALLNYLEIGWSKSKKLPKRLWALILGVRQEWDRGVVEALSQNVGVFPATSAIAEQFAQLYSREIGTMDAVGYWGCVPGESLLLRMFSPKAIPFAATTLEPYLNAESPWSKALKGKRVLLIHPFAESIVRQYGRRKHIFPGTDILPEFHLLTIKAVQSLAGTPTPYNDWFEALQSMQCQMEDIDFDVCLVGAGAYSTPLCAHAKRLGKVAVYVGGSLQILFGIMGRRWDGIPEIARFYNEYWVRPGEAEQIAGATRVEGGCYW